MPQTNAIDDIFRDDANERHRLGLRPLTEIQRRAVIQLSPRDHRGLLWPNEIRRMASELRAADRARARAAAVAALAPRPVARPVAASPTRPATRPTSSRPAARRAEPDPHAPYHATRIGHILRR